MRTTIRTASATLVLLVALTGCSGGGDDDASSTDRSAPVDRAGGGGEAAAPAAPGSADRDAAGGNAGKVGSTSITRGRPATTDRAIAYVGELRVEVEDVTAASSSAITQVAGAGGVLSAQQSALGEGATASLTFKVPPAQFSRLLTSLGRLGEALGQTVTSEDVTEQLVDLDARLRTAKASADRVRALLSRAGTITEIVNLEREVASREAEVESMQARLRSLDGRVEEATLTLLLTADRDRLAPSTGDDRGFITGLRDGWDAFTASAAVVATVAGAVLPFAAVAALLGLAAVVVRRRRGTHATATDPTPVV